MTLALYVPRPTPVHRAPAGPKLLALIGLGVLVFTVPTLPVACCAVVAVLLIGLVAARLPVRVLALQARAVVWWLLVVFAIQWLVSDLTTGAMTSLRLLAVVLGAAVVTTTTRVSEMVVVVERICAPLRWVGVRPARIGLVLAMTLRFIPLVAERAGRIREAQAARGGTVRGPRSVTRTVVPLLVMVLQLAHTVSEALDARGADVELVS